MNRKCNNAQRNNKNKMKKLQLKVENCLTKGNGEECRKTEMIILLCKDVFSLFLSLLSEMILLNRK